MNIHDAKTYLSNKGLATKDVRSDKWLIGGTSIHVDTNGETIDDRFMIARHQDYWIAFLEGPGSNSTVVRVSSSLDQATNAITNYFTMKKDTNETTLSIIEALWQLQASFLIAEITDHNQIGIITTNLQVENWWTPYDLMVNSYHHRIHSINCSCTLTRRKWDLEFKSLIHPRYREEDLELDIAIRHVIDYFGEFSSNEQ